MCRTDPFRKAGERMEDKKPLGIMARIKNMFFPPRPTPPTKEELIACLLRERGTPAIHDMRFRCWGNNLSKCGDSWAIWTPRNLRDGDIVRTERGDFVAAGVRRCGDPHDMYFVDAFYKIEGGRDAD